MRVPLKIILSACLSMFIGGVSHGQSFSNELFIGKDDFVEKIAEDNAFRFQYLVSYFIKDSLVKTEGELKGLYYYPASAIKLPIAMLVMERMNELGLKLDDRLIIDQEVHCGNTTYIRNSQNTVLTFDKMLQELIVVSDNDHYNAFYHFLTPHYINEKLREKGYSDVKLYRAFTGCSKEENLITNGWRVLRNDSLVAKGNKQEFPIDEFQSLYTYDPDKLIGDQHEKNNTIVKGPYDFNYNIEFPLEQLHKVSIDLHMKKSSWNLSDEQRSLLFNWMEQFPKECISLGVDKRIKMEDYVYKYIYSDIKNVRTASKIGLSYGFTTETSIFHCNEATVIVTSSLYTNANKIVNDGVYEYESIARPFLCRFGQLVLDEIGECNE